jgi:hypothetical protein
MLQLALKPRLKAMLTREMGYRQNLDVVVILDFGTMNSSAK